MAELFSLVGTVLKALDYHSKRHNILASNVANADTPGYRPFEIVRPQKDGQGATMSLHKSRDGHMHAANTLADDAEVLEDRTAPVGGDGNAVSLDREMAKLSANDIRYDAAISIVRRKLAELRYVAEDGRS